MRENVTSNCMLKTRRVNAAWLSDIHTYIVDQNTLKNDSSYSSFFSFFFVVYQKSVYEAVETWQVELCFWYSSANVCWNEELTLMLHKMSPAVFLQGMHVCHLMRWHYNGKKIVFSSEGWSLAQTQKTHYYVYYIYKWHLYYHGLMTPVGGNKVQQTSVTPTTPVNSWYRYVHNIIIWTTLLLKKL